MTPHANPQIQAMWHRATRTILDLAPQMDPEYVKSLSDALAPPPPETPPTPPATAAGTPSASRRKNKPGPSDSGNDSLDTETAGKMD